MAQVKEIPLFLMSSELDNFRYRHPEMQYYIKVFYKDESLAGYLAYKNNPENK